MELRSDQGLRRLLQISGLCNNAEIYENVQEESRQAQEQGRTAPAWDPIPEGARADAIVQDGIDKGKPELHLSERSFRLIRSES